MPSLASATFCQDVLNVICGKTATTGFGPGAGVQWIGLHTGNPGISGANASPAARIQVTWNVASGGGANAAVIQSNPVTVQFTNLPAGNYTHYGVYTASVGGSFLYGKELTPAGVGNIPAGSVGTITATPYFTFDVVT